MTSNIFISHFYSTPPITRFLFIIIITLMILVYVNAVQPYTFYYSPLFIKYMELWRPVTCFLYFGKPSLDVLIHMTFLYRYSKMLEEGFTYTSDYLCLLIIVWGLLFLIANILSISTLATAFSSTITYIWTRKNPNAIVQMFGFINFPAFYLPFIVPLFMLITEKHILIEDILGILVGHIYYFFKDVYPKFGADIFRTPCILKKIFREHSDDCCKKVKVNKLSIKNKTKPNFSNLKDDTKISERIIDDSTIIDETNINSNDNETKLCESVIDDFNATSKSIFDDDNTTIIDNKIQDNTKLSNNIIDDNYDNLKDDNIVEDDNNDLQDNVSLPEISLNSVKEDSSIGHSTYNKTTVENNVKIDEENIKDYLDNKEEEDGWSSQTVSEENDDE